MLDGMSIKATARVKLVKYDEDGTIIDVEEREIELTEKEAHDIWHLRQQV